MRLPAAAVPNLDQNSNMQSLFVILLAGLESGLVDPRFLRDWSERIIARTDCPQDWLIKLTVSASEEEARDVLFERLRETDEGLGVHYDELLLGFLFLAHERRLMTSERFILNVFDVFDAGDTILFTPEDILKEASVGYVISNVNTEVLQVLEQLGEASVPLFDSLHDSGIYEKKREYFEQ